MRLIDRIHGAPHRTVDNILNISECVEMEKSLSDESRAVCLMELDNLRRECGLQIYDMREYLGFLVYGHKYEIPILIAECGLGSTQAWFLFLDDITRWDGCRILLTEKVFMTAKHANPDRWFVEPGGYDADTPKAFRILEASREDSADQDVMPLKI